MHGTILIMLKLVAMNFLVEKEASKFGHQQMLLG